MSDYVPPERVSAPRGVWRFDHVLYDCGPGDWVVAEGFWEGGPCLAIRWNGSAERPLGTPQARGKATWFILPQQMDGFVRQAVATHKLLAEGGESE